MLLFASGPRTLGARLVRGNAHPFACSFAEKPEPQPAAGCLHLGGLEGGSGGCTSDLPPAATLPRLLPRMRRPLPLSSSTSLRMRGAPGTISISVATLAWQAIIAQDLTQPSFEKPTQRKRSVRSVRPLQLEWQSIQHKDRVPEQGMGATESESPNFENNELN